MVKVNIQNLLFTQVGNNVKNLLDNANIIYVTSKLNDILKERNLNYHQLAELTGVRSNTISDIANLRKTKIAPAHVAAIMLALKLTDIRDIIDIQIEKDTN
jgi:predicted XRE-type DNA-binding protein